MNDAVDRLDYVRRGLRQEADRPEPEPSFSMTLFASARKAAAAAAIASTLVVGVANAEDAIRTVESVAGAAIEYVNTWMEPDSSEETTSLPQNGPLPAREDLQRYGLLLGLSVNANEPVDVRIDTSEANSFVSREWLVTTELELPESPPQAVEIGRSMVEATRIELDGLLQNSTDERRLPVRINFYVVSEVEFPFGSDVSAVIGLDAISENNLQFSLHDPE